jgi:anti-sigma factor RsiW
VNCQIAQNNLSAYLDRELPGDAMIALRNHIDQCSDCQRELEALRDVKTSLASMVVVDPKEGFTQEVMALVSGSSNAGPKMPVGLVVATSVAAAVMALLLFNVFFGAADRPTYADDRFDAATDTAVTAPDFGGHAPLNPVGR